jgi:O-antigen/teichoic acid export membrane protein
MAGDSDSRLRGLFKGGGVVFAGLILELAISFVAKLVIARVLGRQDYGSVSLGITIMAVTSILVLVGLNTGIGRYLPRYDDEAHQRGVLVSALQLSMPIAILAGIGVAYFAPVIAGDLFGEPSITPVIRIFGLVIPFATLWKLAVGGIQGMQQSLPKVYIQNITLPVLRFAGIALALALGFRTVGVAWAYALSHATAAAFGFYYLARYTPLFASIEYVPMRRELLVFSAPLVVSTTMTIIFSDIDTFLLGYFSTIGDVAVYNVVYPIAQLLVVGLSSFAFLFMPTLSELHADGDYNDMKRYYQIITKWVFMGTLPVFLVVVLFPRTSIRLTFGAEYAAGGTALAVLATGFFTHAIAGPNGRTLTSIGRTQTIMYDNALAAVVNLLLNLALIPRYSFLGAAVATAVAYGLLNVVYTYQLYRTTGIHPFTAALVRPGIAAVVLASVVYWVVSTFFTITVSVLAIAFAVFLALYGLIILRFGGIEEEEVMLVVSFEERFDVDLGPLKTVARKMLR